MHFDNGDSGYENGDDLSDNEIESSSDDRFIASHVPRARGRGQICQRGGRGRGQYRSYNISPSSSNSPDSKVIVV